MKPLDPRLLRYARATRAYLAVSVLLGVATAALILAQAWLLAWLVDAAFLQGRALAALRGPLLALVLVVLGRALVVWGTELAAHRSSALVKSQLRAGLLERAVAQGPGWLRGQRTGDLATLATRGVDALDGYFSRYLPQLVLAVIVPVTVLLAVLDQDWLSALIIALTLPLIPIFMILIGLQTRRHTERQFRTLQLLAGYFLDVVAGLPTLKVFGRAKAQATALREVTDRYRRATMGTLRIAFLSSLVLELIATIAVALVAVSVGLRLLGGGLDLRTALFVLVLAPEAYLPLRQVGANFHASAEGLTAAEQVFEVLDEPLPRRGTRTDVPDPATTPLEVRDLVVRYPDREGPALNGLSFALEPGEVLAVMGPSGAGKTSLLQVLLGFVAPEAGRVSLGGVDLADLDPDAWRAAVAWVPQRPHLFAATLEANIRLGRPDATDAEVARAADDAGLGEVLAGLPEGLRTMVGERGAGLSAGERQRVALARAFLRDAPLLLLDEPTSNLDGATEAAVLSAVARLARGRTVLLTAHRPALLSLADRVLRLDADVAVAEVLR